MATTVNNTILNIWTLLRVNLKSYHKKIPLKKAILLTWKKLSKCFCSNNTNEKVLRQTQKMMKYNHFYDEERGNLISILGSAVNRLCVWGQVTEPPWFSFNKIEKLSNSNSMILNVQVHIPWSCHPNVSLLCASSCVRLRHTVSKMGKTLL